MHVSCSHNNSVTSKIMQQSNEIGYHQKLHHTSPLHWPPSRSRPVSGSRVYFWNLHSVFKQSSTPPHIHYSTMIKLITINSCPASQWIFAYCASKKQLDSAAAAPRSLWCGPPANCISWINPWISRVRQPAFLLKFALTVKTDSCLLRRCNSDNTRRRLSPLNRDGLTASQCPLLMTGRWYSSPSPLPSRNRATPPEPLKYRALSAYCYNITADCVTAIVCHSAPVTCPFWILRL